MASVTRATLSLSLLCVTMSMDIVFEQRFGDGLRDGKAKVAFEHAPFAAGVDFEEHVLARRSADQIYGAEYEAEFRHQCLQTACDFRGQLGLLPATLLGCDATPVRLPARRVTRIERACEGLTGNTSNAQFARFRNQLLKDHRAMPKCLSMVQVFFADAARVDEGRRGIHADGDRAKELRYRLTFSFYEEVSSCGGIVGNESERDAQAGARGEPELSLLVLGGALALKVVDPACVVKRVEKTFKRRDRLCDAH